MDMIVHTISISSSFSSFIIIALELVMILPLLFNTVSVNFGTVILDICFRIRSRNKNALADPSFHKS